MNLYLISQDEDIDYDTYDSAVVAAETSEEAAQLSPSGDGVMDWNKSFSSWCSSVEKVSVRYLGKAAEGIEKGVICASFNAG